MFGGKLSWVGAAGRVGMSTSIEEVAAAELPDAKELDVESILVDLFNNKKDRIMLVTGVFIVQGGEISRWCFCSLVLVVNFLTKVLFTSYSEFFVNVDQSFWLAEVFS